MGPIAPLLIVSDVAAAVRYYEERLGFDLTFSTPAYPFFAIVTRGDTSIHLKAVEAKPAPNHTRDEFALWDAFVFVADPEALAEELTERGATIRSGLKRRQDGLYGFEVADLDGYVFFCGRPT